MNRPKQPLYRRYNKLARGFHHNSPGGDFSHERNSKAMKTFQADHQSMRRTKEGYDYTPLFQFLLSKVGQNWDEVFSEAVSRLDKQDPIFWLVDPDYKKGDSGIVRVGESTYFSRLTVDDNVLIVADANAAPPAKSCTCCTFTFNGVVY